MFRLLWLMFFFLSVNLLVTHSHSSKYVEGVEYTIFTIYRVYTLNYSLLVDIMLLDNNNCCASSLLMLRRSGFAPFS